MKNTPKQIGTGIWINEKVTFGKKVEIGHSSCIGFPVENETQCSIGNSVNIGAFSLVSMGVKIDNYTKIDHYCRVDRGTKIGSRTQILFGTRIHEDVKIGHNCIIAGSCSDNVHIGNKVEHYGRIVHSRNDPNKDYDGEPDPAPRIGDGVIIYANSLIIGGIKLGKQSIIMPGEIVRENVPAQHIFSGGKSIPVSKWNNNKIRLKKL